MCMNNDEKTELRAIAALFVWSLLFNMMQNLDYLNT